MDLLPLIITFLAAYGFFLAVAYALSRFFFPNGDSHVHPVNHKRDRVRIVK